MAYMPVDMVEKILLRLPTKSVVRFRSVCKSWRSLISSPHLSKLHLQRARIEDPYKPIIFCGFPHDHLLSRILSFCFRAYFGPSNYGKNYYIRDGSSPVKLRFPVFRRINGNKGKCKGRQQVSIVGSCDGLLFLVIDDWDMVLWNPCTSDWHAVPDPNPVGFLIFYGFGYDPSTDNYIAVAADCRQVEGEPCLDMMTYSLKTNSWRSIGPFQYGIAHEQTGVFLNGAIHLVSSHEVNEYGHRQSVYVIVAIDLREGSMTVMQLPLTPPGEFHFLLYPLRVLGGRLCAIFFSYWPQNVQNRNNLEVWIMKDYGERSSWTKLTSIPYELHSSNKEDFMWSNDQGLIKYNCNKILTQRSAEMVPSLWDASLTYLTTFLSPKPSNHEKVIQKEENCLSKELC